MAERNHLSLKKHSCGSDAPGCGGQVIAHSHISDTYIPVRGERLDAANVNYIP
ncbi:hypothetical protein I41_28740 [Lacipirellula limnantheis]|uniref:Uncharacterized protein n=1 Tax=Lacipirellula limnantheis TaxID=2528024 RepID=A0A517TZ92_9BACT|nr:hypothetical protein I41_28740 [Lacipirellula limnantheis]